MDLHTLLKQSLFLSQVKVNWAYELKVQKIQLVDLNLSDGFKLDESNTWRLDAIKKKTPIFLFTYKYMHRFIPKFISITKETRLTLEQLGKMSIEDGMTI